jgi:hypothetical protein
MPAGRLLKLLQQLAFESLRINGHFAGFNLLLGGAVITELADAKALGRPNRWSKDAAGHGTGQVQVTEAGGGIQSRTRLVVGEVLKTGFSLFRRVQQAGYRVTGKARGEALDRFPRPLANGLRSFRLPAAKFLKSLLQTGRVELMDSEDADAALCAPGLADQPIATAARGVGQRRVNDLHQLGVTRGKHRTRLNHRKPGKINVVYNLMTVLRHE